MKIRNKFVSNSSSSSFIVSCKNKPKLIVEIDIEDLSDTTIKSKNHLDKYLLNEWEYETIEECLKEDEFYKEIYNKCLKELESGNILYCGSVCNDDDMISSFIYSNGFNGESNFKVIQNPS